MGQGASRVRQPGEAFIQRRQLIGGLGASALAGALGSSVNAARKPNIIVVLADDLGYGDLGTYGSRLVRTPALDRMAREGIKLTNAYASANVCTPSRAGLLTGRYPIRTGLAQDVIRQSDTHGLPLDEVTIPEALKPDYVTALIGKWHLGHVAPFWPPTVQGFDLFYGLPYSHDMKPLALYESRPGVELIKEDVDFPRLTERFFQRGQRFIDENRQRPFFLMMALTAPHYPLQPHPDVAGHSQAGAYGDVVREIDRGVGGLLEQLKTLGLDSDTLVIVTSDNGPWFEGSSGPLRDRKGGAGWEGGYRVPFLARQPGRIPAGKVSPALSMNIDLMPTLTRWAGTAPPAGIELDGRDIGPVLTRGAASPHDQLVLFNNEDVAGIRTERWKYVARTYYRGLDLPLDGYGYDLLFDMRADPGELYNVDTLHPDVMADMAARFKAAQAKFKPFAKGKKRG